MKILKTKLKICKGQMYRLRADFTPGDDCLYLGYHYQQEQFIIPEKSIVLVLDISCVKKEELPRFTKKNKLISKYWTVKLLYKNQIYERQNIHSNRMPLWFGGSSLMSKPIK